MHMTLQLVKFARGRGCVVVFLCPYLGSCCLHVSPEPTQSSGSCLGPIPPDKPHGPSTLTLPSPCTTPRSRIWVPTTQNLPESPASATSSEGPQVLPGLQEKRPALPVLLLPALPASSLRQAEAELAFRFLRKRERRK